jgi:hypothetical protein
MSGNEGTRLCGFVTFVLLAVSGGIMLVVYGNQNHDAKDFILVKFVPVNVTINSTEETNCPAGTDPFNPVGTDAASQYRIDKDQCENATLCLIEVPGIEKMWTGDSCSYTEPHVDRFLLPLGWFIFIGGFAGCCLCLFVYKNKD